MRRIWGHLAAAHWCSQRLLQALLVWYQHSRNIQAPVGWGWSLLCHLNICMDVCPYSAASCWGTMEIDCISTTTNSELHSCWHIVGNVVDIASNIDRPINFDICLNGWVCSLAGSFLGLVSCDMASRLQGLPLFWHILARWTLVDLQFDGEMRMLQWHNTDSKSFYTSYSGWQYPADLHPCCKTKNG